MLPMQNLSEIVGHNLMTMRKAKGMTQQQIAEKLNYSDKSISKWENGYAVPSVDILKEFAEFYGVTIDFLITEQSDDAVLNAANHEEAVEEKKQQANKAVVIALANVVVILIFTLVFVSNLISGKLDGMANYMLFLWAVPACMAISMISVRVLYGRKGGNRIAYTVMGSVFQWTLILDCALHFYFVATPPQNLFFILAVCVPVQVIIILLYFMKRQPE